MAKITLDPNRYSMLDEDEKLKMAAKTQSLRGEDQKEPETKESAPGYNQAIQAVASSPSTGSGTGDLMKSGGALLAASGGNPSVGAALIGGGLVLGAREKKKQAEYEAKLQRITRMQNALQYLGQMSQGLNTL